MLQLLCVPRWVVDGQAPRLLPATVPACLLIHLAVEGSWIDRERLAELFWPGEPAGEALRKLRVNLHRVRGLLDAWGRSDALLAERHRVCLSLPCDVHTLRDGGVLTALQPQQWLQGFRIPGFAGFWDWADARGAQWIRDPAPDFTAPVTVLPGRDAEQAALRASGVPALVVVGEPGAGKSALLRAVHPQAWCLQGREGQGGVPFGPLLECLRDHDSSWRETLATPGPLAAYRLDLARLLPELLSDEPLPPLDAHTAKVRLLEALARVFERSGPVLLVDDLQWLDAATLEWLGFVAHRARQRWRATARRHELSDAALQLCNALRAAGRLDELPLGPLSRDAVDLLCRRRWPLRRWDVAALDALHRACAGNPFVLGELVAMGEDATLGGAVEPVLPRRVQDLVHRHLRGLSPAARAAVDTAAVLARPAPVALLVAVALPDDEVRFVQGCDEALAADLLASAGAGLQCRHDLVRQGTLAAMSPARRAWLHGRAAQALQGGPTMDPLVLAAHWDAAGQPQAALPWLLQGAQQQKDRGRFDEAQALWRRVADETDDGVLALRARLAMAEADLLHDLAHGRQALQSVLHEAAALDDTAARDEIGAQALAGLVDNAVFAGDLALAATQAQALRERLPRLRGELALHACEVLIELAMREPDIDAAWALLARVRARAPRRPSLLSFEGQIHWYAGNARGARDALQALLATHPDFCRGLTIENDLAVMLNALGEFDAAERMTRRSLDSWRDVPHTQTLSLLVLGSVLCNLGRLGEAQDSLDQALSLARSQASPGFEAEALTRRARLHLLAGRPAAALADLDAAQPLQADSTEPLRVSQYELYRVLALAALDRPLADDGLRRLQAIARRSAHPLLLVRLSRLQAELALSQGDPAAARQQFRLALAQAQQAGLAEPALAAEQALSALGRAAVC